MNNLNDIMDSLFEQEFSASGENFRKRKGELETTEDFVAILKGEKKFEGDIDTPEEMQAIIDGINKIHDEIKNTTVKVDKNSPSYQMRRRLVSFYDKAQDIQKILNKIKSGKKISEKESDMFDEFAEQVEDVLFHETYMKKMFAAEKGETSSILESFQKAIPIKYTSPKGKDYYGLIRPPSGTITWQGQQLSNKSAPTEVRDIIKQDDEVNLGSQIPFDESSNTVLRGAKNVRRALDSGRIEILDDPATVKKVRKAFENSGVEYSSRGWPKNLNKVIKSVDFWKKIKNLF